jgi:hypothetical protein
MDWRYPHTFGYYVVAQSRKGNEERFLIENNSKTRKLEKLSDTSKILNGKAVTCISLNEGLSQIGNSHNK